VAAQLGVAGWVRNLADGRVEVVAEGDPAAVAPLVEWCGHGPRRADVRGVEVVEEPPEGLSGFSVR
jgi:acylphosphatase